MPHASPDAAPSGARGRRSSCVAWCMLAAAAATASGCSQSRSFEGHTRDEVWQAMVAAAKQPRYRDWMVMDNMVWTDEPGARVEIWRELKRDVVLPGQKPYREEAEWRLRGTLEPGDLPVVRFSTSDLCIPAHFWLQADHYFDEVQSRLMAMAPARAIAPSVPMDLDDPMLLPPASLSARDDARDDPLDSVPPPDAAPSGRRIAPPPPPPAARPSGQSQPIDIP
ncbi:MAG: hypothetical protein KF724_03555 [Phycisphaeraceae bacterium]|nr:hypothetical protein [Phycisphaeraceae bacterium]